MYWIRKIFSIALACYIILLCCVFLCSQLLGFYPPIISDIVFGVIIFISDFIFFNNNLFIGIIFIIIFIITLCVWNKWRKENPNNPPKLFWTLIFGWIYLLYYWCNKKGI